MEDHTKIQFQYSGSSTDGIQIETMWAVPVETGYKLDNIPFFAVGVAVGDIVTTTSDSDGRLRFQAIHIASGHSTVRLWFRSDFVQEVSCVRERLREMGCSSEQSDLDQLIAVDIPPAIAYESIRKFLDQKEHQGIFEYEEACLGFR